MCANFGIDRQSSPSFHRDSGRRTLVNTVRHLVTKSEDTVSPSGMNATIIPVSDIGTSEN